MRMVYKNNFNRAKSIRTTGYGQFLIKYKAYENFVFVEPVRWVIG